MNRHKYASYYSQGNTVGLILSRTETLTRHDLLIIRPAWFSLRWLSPYKLSDSNIQSQIPVVLRNTIISKSYWSVEWYQSCILDTSRIMPTGSIDCQSNYTTLKHVSQTNDGWFNTGYQWLTAAATFVYQYPVKKVKWYTWCFGFASSSPNAYIQGHKKVNPDKVLVLINSSLWQSTGARTLSGFE